MPLKQLTREHGGGGELENRETVRRQTCVLIEELLIAHRRAAAIKESREVGHRRLLAALVNPNR